MPRPTPCSTALSRALRGPPPGSRWSRSTGRPGARSAWQPNVVVPERMRAARNAFLRTGIATEAGVDAFARILGSRRRRVIMTSDDLEAPFARGGTPAVSVTPGDRTAQAHSGAPGPLSAADRGDVRNPPVTDTEKCLATIWTELIGDTGLGVDDDFFDLGGHSLLATRVLARVAATHGGSSRPARYFRGADDTQPGRADRCTCRNGIPPPWRKPRTIARKS